MSTAISSPFHQPRNQFRQRLIREDKRTGDFRSFFGPSKPAFIPQRVIRQEPKPIPAEEIPAKRKAELIRYSRDYSILLADDPIVATAPLAQPPENKPVPAELKRSAAVEKPKPLVRARKEEEDEPEPRPKKRKRSGADDELDKARIMIRKMFGYNPDKYGDDDYDDRNMVAGFNDILKEESRSSKFGRKMDAQEEKRERLKKTKKPSRKPSFFPLRNNIF